MREECPPWVRFLQVFFYAAFIVLWFKDNFAPLRKLPAGYLAALLPFLGLVGFRFYWKIREGQFKIPPKISRDVVWLVLLLLLTAVIRIPYLAVPNGMMNSDDAIMALMGKHIAEGEVPPVCFYGQLYMGSLSSHLYAAAFRIFGYSMLVLKSATLFVYLAFVAVQFVFLREIFSLPFALAVGFFYSLPITPLLTAGFDNTSAYPLVLLLGSLLLYLAYLISFRAKDKLIPVLGFVMGTALWTHQVTAALILTSFLMLAVKRKWVNRMYGRLLAYALLGFLPQLLIEVFNRFQLAAFLTQGKRAVNWATVKEAAGLAVSLLAPGSPLMRYLVLLLILSGFIYLAVVSLKKGTVLPSAAFCLFPLLFFLLYVFSYFSTKSAVRYSFPLYISLPVLFLAAVLAFPPRVRRVLPFGLVTVLFIGPNLRPSLAHYQSVKARHVRIAQAARAMSLTGHRYWCADYWTAYLLTAVSGEQLVVDALTHNRYPPYTLAYWNQTDKDNFVFLLKETPDEEAHYSNLVRWLEAFGIGAKKEDVEDCRLLYDLDSRFYPASLLREIPPQFPHLELDSLSASGGYLNLVFKNQTVGEDIGFRLKMEIPGFSSRSQRFSLADAQVRAQLPYPRSPGFSVHYALDFAGIGIPATKREILFSPSPDDRAEREDPLVYLLGFGPEALIADKNRLICEKDVSWEINRPAGDHLEVRIVLYSPFQFSDWRWYGKYSQNVEIVLNRTYSTERELKDGPNTVRLTIPKKYLKDRGNILTLKFRYQTWLFLARHWEIAAFLDKIDFF